MTISLAIGSRLPPTRRRWGGYCSPGYQTRSSDAYIARTKFERVTERTVTDPEQFRAIIEKVR